MNDFTRRQEHQNRLRAWVKAAGKHQYQLGELAAYFNFSGKRTGRSMGPSTVARTIGDLPANKSGMYNLYAILGVFYMLRVATRQEIEAFLIALDIHRVPEGKTWHQIWEIIEKGAQEGRKQLPTPMSRALEADDLRLPTYPSMKFGHRRHTYLVLVVALISLISAGSGGLIVHLASPAAARLSPTSPIYVSSPSGTKAGLGAIATVYPGPTCAESILDIEVYLTTKNSATSGLIGFVAIDGNGVIIMARLIYFGPNGVYRQSLSVNLRHLTPMTARPVMIKLFEVAYNSTFKLGTSSLEVYNFIEKTGTLLAETTLDPATTLPACGELPLVSTPPPAIAAPERK